MKVGFFADMQMGANRYLSLAEQETVLSAALAGCRAENVDAIAFGGDFFQNRSPSPDAILAWERPLIEHREALGAQIYGVVGNHDLSNLALGSSAEILSVPGLLTVARAPELYCAKNPGLWIAALPWAPVHRVVASSNGGDRDDANTLTAAHLLNVARGLFADFRRMQRPDDRCLLLTHFMIDAATLPNGAPVSAAVMCEPILNAGELAEIGFDAILAGHLQKPQFVIADPPIIYAGSPHCMDFGEEGYEHGFWVLDLQPQGVDARFIPIESRRFLTLDLDDPDPVAQLRLSAQVGFNVPEGSIVRVRLSPTEEQARRLDQRELTQALMAGGASRVEWKVIPIRETRARVEGIDETLDEKQAFALWLGAEGVDEGLRAKLSERHAQMLEEAAA